MNKIVQFRRYYFLKITFVFLISLHGIAAHAQNVGLTLKEPKAARVYYVSVNGSGDGSSAKPFGNITQALETALQFRATEGKTVKVIIRDGIYRQAVNIQKNYSAPESAFLVLEAEHKGMVVLSGALPLSGWRNVDDREKPFFWTTISDSCIKALTIAGNKEFPNGEVKNPWPKQVKTRGGMFINGQLKVGNNYYFPGRAKDSLVLGSFFIDYNDKKIFVKLRSKEGMENSELAVLPTIFNISNNNNFIMRGINVEQAGWTMSKAVKFDNMENLLVEDCHFNHNRYSGLEIHKLKNATFRRMELCHNGGKGGGGSWAGYLKNVLFDGVKVNYNNWINANYGWYGWDPCGFKFSAIRQLVIKDSEFNGNFAVGLWPDTEFKNLEIINTTMANNYGPGIMIEASLGPTKLINCSVYNNDYGVYLSAAENVTLEACHVFNNNIQIGVFDHWGKGRGFGSEGQFDFADIDTQQKWTSHTVNTVIKNCKISNASFNSNALVMPRYNDTIGYKNFIGTLKFENNKLEYGASGTSPFIKGVNSLGVSGGDWKEN